MSVGIQSLIRYFVLLYETYLPSYQLMLRLGQLSIYQVSVVRLHWVYCSRKQQQQSVISKYETCYLLNDRLILLLCTVKDMLAYTRMHRHTLFIYVDGNFLSCLMEKDFISRWKLFFSQYSTSPWWRQYEVPAWLLRHYRSDVLLLYWL